MCDIIAAFTNFVFGLLWWHVVEAF
jgi:hypothetical protein